MSNFKATFYNGTLNEISSNGTQLVIVDNSNYADYVDQAQAGGASTITLATSASSYNDFYKNLEARIIAGTGIGQGGIITGYNGSTKIATIATTFSPTPDSTSVYEIGERGHLQSYFTDYRKILITEPNGTAYLFSTLGDGNATLAKAFNQTLPITDNYTYGSGDGVYTVRLSSVPTWSATVSYLFINQPFVYYNGSLYKCLKNGLNKQPDIETTYWEVLVGETGLGSRYYYETKVAVYCDINNCWLSAVASAETFNECNMCNQELFMRNSAVQKAFQLKLALYSIPVNAYLNQWSKVQDTINFAKQLCCCTENNISNNCCNNTI